MIDLTPLEVRKKKGDFRRALRGYEPVLVDDFLDLAADRIEQLARDNASRTDRLAELERRVAEYRDRERALTDALVTAQQMREEIRVQSTREAELTLRTSTQEAEARVREAEQRSETVLREAEQRAETVLREAERRAEAVLWDAEQRAETLVRDAEQRSQTMLREAELHATTTVRAAEQGADDTLRRAQQEADAELLHAQQEADRLQSDVIQVREREEDALRRLRLHQQQQLNSYRNFLQRELAELDMVTTSLALGETPSPTLPADGAAGEGGDADLEADLARPSQPRDSRAAAAAAVLAQSFLAEDTDTDQLLDEAFPVDEADLEPFEPEPVYEEDLEPVRVRDESAEDLEPVRARDESAEDLEPLRARDESAKDLEPSGAREETAELRAEEEEAGPEPAEIAGDDAETTALLENAELAGYHLDLDIGDDVPDDVPEGPELLLEEPASEEGDDGDWLSSLIEEKP